MFLFLLVFIFIGEQFRGGEVREYLTETLSSCFLEWLCYLVLPPVRSKSFRVPYSVQHLILAYSEFSSPVKIFHFGFSLMTFTWTFYIFLCLFKYLSILVIYLSVIDPWALCIFWT